MTDRKYIKITYTLNNKVETGIGVSGMNISCMAEGTS